MDDLIKIGRLFCRAAAALTFWKESDEEEARILRRDRRALDRLDALLDDVAVKLYAENDPSGAELLLKEFWRLIGGPSDPSGGGSVGLLVKPEFHRYMCSTLRKRADELLFVIERVRPFGPAAIQSLEASLALLAAEYELDAESKGIQDAREAVRKGNSRTMSAGDEMTMDFEE